MSKALILFVLSIFFMEFIVSIPNNFKTQCESKVTSCLAGENKKPVCGNDNQTYPSKCYLRQLQCVGSTVVIKHDGPCIEKSNTKRRSMNPRKKGKKGCSRADKVEFRLNLLNIFVGEHERSFGIQADDEVILEWKFNAIDVDNDGFLHEPEYRLLRRLLRKVVHPRRCAKIFDRMCDSNNDAVISNVEWLACLSRDKLTSNLQSNSQSAAEGLRNQREQIAKTKPALLLQGSMTVSANFGNLDEPIDRSKDDLDSNDCLSDRKAALDDQKNGDWVMYVPECTVDGRYQNVQCYKSTGYCWCVHQDSGKPIPGTSIKDQNPKCETTSTSHRPMKGCPEQNKRKFLKDLMEFFNTERLKGMNGTGISSVKWPVSREEQIASWSFVALDVNKNKILERKEWKSFRALVSENHLLRRCGKKLPRYCDINHDRKISMTEWLKCLDTQSSPQTESGALNTSSAPSSSKRKGPNPLESYLKAD